VLAACSWHVASAALERRVEGVRVERCECVAVAVVVYGAGINAVEYYGSRRSRWR
jgi:hypothetical protein